MLMSKVEIAGCFKLLRAYWPGDWDEARYAVWLEAWQDYPVDAVRDALVRLGRTAKFPTVAEFIELIDGATAGGVIRGRKGMFLPGTGWVNEHEAHPELGSGGTDAPVVDFAEMRRKLRGAAS